MAFLKFNDSVSFKIYENFTCICESPEHDITFELDPEVDYLTVNVYLSHYLPWYKRLFKAILYVFGIKGAQGDYDSFIFKKEDIPRLISALESVRDKNV